MRKLLKYLFLVTLLPGVILPLCGCGPRGNTDRFKVDDEGVITDTQTGLQWLVGPNEPTGYPDAILWVAGLETAGGGWQMPTCEELKTLLIDSTRPLDPAFGVQSYVQVWGEPISDIYANVYSYKQASSRQWLRYGANHDHCRVFAVRVADGAQRSSLPEKPPPRQSTGRASALPASYGVYAVSADKLTRLEEGSKVIPAGNVDSIIWFDKGTTTYSSMKPHNTVSMTRLATVSQEVEIMYEHSTRPPVALKRKAVGFWHRLDEEVELEAQPVADQPEMIRFVGRRPFAAGGYVLTIHGNTLGFASGPSMRFAEQAIELEEVLHVVKEHNNLGRDDSYRVLLFNTTYSGNRPQREHIVFKTEYLPLGTTKDLRLASSGQTAPQLPQAPNTPSDAPQASGTKGSPATAPGEANPASQKNSKEADAPMPTDHVLFGNTLYLRKIANVQFGMSVPEAEAALGEPLVGERSPYEDPNCYHLRPKSIPDGLYFMVEAERIVRVEIDIEQVRTGSGVHVGGSASSLREIYPHRLVVEENRYDPLVAEYIYVPKDDVDKDFRMLFAVKDGKVIHMRAGLLPAVLYCEGCL